MPNCNKTELLYIFIKDEKKALKLEKIGKDCRFMTKHLFTLKIRT